MSQFNILLLNGPNLNLLGKRESNIYGNKNLNDVLDILKKKANKMNAKITHLQSNAEHILVEKIHQSQDFDYIIINPAAFTHTSIALRDAFLSIKKPFIEVHISNIYAREKFRKKSFLSDISNGVISGFGIEGYYWALKTAINRLIINNKYN
ncbi:type II 3-dehydroquinate dehydratase [Buchnera aphidicola]|uniref:type II 3-dehydroquinate dehydratase n=1 Tax=Buchnera aphidicola TaxID=9 RepID=UPI0034645794